jgi:hypothetical protein
LTERSFKWYMGHTFHGGIDHRNEELS